MKKNNKLLSLIFWLIAAAAAIGIKIYFIFLGG